MYKSLQTKQHSVSMKCFDIFGQASKEKVCIYGWVCNVVVYDTLKETFFLINFIRGNVKGIMFIEILLNSNIIGESEKNVFFITSEDGNI